MEGELKAFPAEITYYGKIKATLNWVVPFPWMKDGILTLFVPLYPFLGRILNCHLEFS